MNEKKIKYSEGKDENINHHPSHYIIKDEIFEELKASVKALVEAKKAVRRKTINC